MDVPVYKIASFENLDLQLIRRVATIGEIDEAVRGFLEAGGNELALLACMSS